MTYRGDPRWVEARARLVDDHEDLDDHETLRIRLAAIAVMDERENSLPELESAR